DGQKVTVIATDYTCIGEPVEINVIVSDLPNAFTPGSDGFNDIFGAGAELTIFNRWGQVIYEGTEGWDGKYKGKKVSPGTYYYILSVFDANNTKTTMKGSVTVVSDEK
ncbi:MAG: gliding motility-associated C-terminal domain-containing protein, partial [Bacteroidales bacterium]|nr:gliding motility-associated C-terminal domain-containing protein [Bacteroidales bacterium]